MSLVWHSVVIVAHIVIFVTCAHSATLGFLIIYDRPRKHYNNNNDNS